MGILRILIENNIALDVVALLDKALAQFIHAFNLAETREKIIDFIFDRLKGYCLDHGYSVNEFEAVLAVLSHAALKLHVANPGCAGVPAVAGSRKFGGCE